MARTPSPDVRTQDKALIGALLRELRRAAGYRSVEGVASKKGSPASRQTIYAYERGGLVPSLAQFLALVEFYVLDAPAPGREAGGRPARAGDRRRDPGAVAAGVPRRAGAGPDRPDAAGSAGEDVTIALTDLDHVGIAVEDLEAAVERYRTTLGVEPSHRERVEDQGVEEALFAVGTSYIQLLGALGPDTPVGRHLAKRGPGVHHVAYRVVDVVAALEHLRGAGVELIDEAPRSGSRGTLIAFVHPRSMGGVLVELVQER